MYLPYCSGTLNLSTSIPSPLWLCSQPTLSVIDVATYYIFLVCYIFIMLCLPSLLWLPKAVIHAYLVSFAYIVICFSHTYIWPTCHCNLYSSMALYYAYQT